MAATHSPPPQAIANIPSVSWEEQVGDLLAYSFPTITVDPFSGNVIVAWTQNDNGDLNVYYAYSANHGASWSIPTIATQTTSGPQFSPALTSNSSGIVSLAYYQAPSSSSILVDLYLADSYNSGQSFSQPNIRVTPSSFNANLYPHTYSEYISVTSTPNGCVLPVWTDMRNNTDENIYTALYVIPPQNLQVSGPGNPHLTWTAGSGNYEVSRGIGTQWTVIANPTTNSYMDGDYSIVTRGGGTVSYRVRAQAQGNFSDYSNVASCRAMSDQKKLGKFVEVLPDQNGLDQNYPNPFNPSTKISYEVKDPSLVKLVVYDRLGREVRTFINEFKQPGYYDTDVTLKEQASGLYFYKIQIGQYSEVKKMLYMK